MRIVKWLLPMLMICGAAYGQAQVQPMVQNGTNPTTRCAVGGADGTGCPIPITGTITASTGVITVTATDRGGTLTAGGTAQNAAASNTSRKGFVIQNPCTATGENIAAVEDLYVSVTGAATVAGAGNFADLAPCGSASLIVAPGSVIQTAVSVNATTINHRWTATEVQ